MTGKRVVFDDGDPVIAEAHVSPTAKIEVPSVEPIVPVQDLIASALQARPELALPTATAAPVRKSSRAGKRAASEASPEAVDADTLARLKQWRTAEARRHGMPPYVIFHDRTLAQLAAARPGDLDGLRRVPGIGPAKLERYGDALLAVLSEG